MNQTGILQRLKEKAKTTAASISGQIVQIPADARAFVCPNHFQRDNKGRTVNQKVVIVFNPREKERTCECGTIYKRV